MSDVPSIGFHDAATIEAIPLSVWTQLLDAVGYPPSLSANALDYPSLRTALARGDLPEAVARALQTIHDLSTDSARETLLEVAAVRGVDASTWHDVAPAELIARLCAEARTQESIDRMLQWTQLSIYEARAPRAVKEFAGRSPRDLDPGQGKQLERELAAWFFTNGMGNHVEVNVITVEDEVRFIIVHERRLMAPLVASGQGRIPLPHRPIQCDLLRYQPSSGRLKISAPYPRLVRQYRESAGRVLFGDPDFFENESACSLAPLRDDGAAVLLRHACPEVEQVRLTHAVWHAADGDKCTFTSEDCFALVNRVGFRLAEGDLFEVRLAIKFYGRPPNRVTATLRETNHLEYPPDSPFGEVIEKMLCEIGLWRAVREHSQRDLWGLAAGAHSLEAWRSAFGREVDGMIRGGLLRRVQLAAVAEHDHSAAARVLDVRPTNHDPPFLGVSPNAGTAGRPLSPTDVQGYQLDVLSIARLLARELQLEGAIETTIVDGLLDLGRRTLGHTPIRVLLAVREPKLSHVQLVQLVHSHQGTVVLVPKGCLVAAGFPIAEFSHLLPPHRDTLRSIIQGLHLDDQVEALLLAPPAARLVLDQTLRRAWLDQTELVALNDQPFDFVRLVVVAANEQHVLSTAELELKLSKRDGSARQAKKRALDAIRKSFDFAQRPVPKDLDSLFETQRNGNGYRLTASFFVR